MDEGTGYASSTDTGFNNPCFKIIWNKGELIICFRYTFTGSVGKGKEGWLGVIAYIHGT